ncbi:hypothetical protein GN956_G22845 [Arapaima gigas]
MCCSAVARLGPARRRRRRLPPQPLTPPPPSFSTGSPPVLPECRVRSGTREARDAVTSSRSPCRKFLGPSCESCLSLDCARRGGGSGRFKGRGSAGPIQVACARAQMWTQGGTAVVITRA